MKCTLCSNTFLGCCSCKSEPFERHSQSQWGYYHRPGCKNKKTTGKVAACRATRCVPDKCRVPTQRLEYGMVVLEDGVEIESKKECQIF